MSVKIILKMFNVNQLNFLLKITADRTPHTGRFPPSPMTPTAEKHVQYNVTDEILHRIDLPNTISSAHTPSISL